MTGCRAELDELAADVEGQEGVVAAWAAKSFTDQVLFVEVPDGHDVPDAVIDRLAAHGLAGANEAYGIASGDDSSSAGPVGDRHQHRFVDPEASDWLAGRPGD